MYNLDALFHALHSSDGEEEGGAGAGYDSTHAHCAQAPTKYGKDDVAAV